MGSRAPSREGIGAGRQDAVMDSWGVSEELSREAVARCCAELVAVIEAHAPAMRPGDPDAEALGRLAVRLRRLSLARTR